jgi:cobalt-zinc-cadmium efflux system protein
MQATPDKALYKDVVDAFAATEHVVDAHHVHLWSLDGENHVLTAHLQLDDCIGYVEQRYIKADLNNRLSEFNFIHTTIEFEFPDEECRDDN